MQDKNLKPKTISKNDKEKVKVNATEVLDKENGHKIQMYTEMHQGPLPHPMILKGYEDVLPGAAERILKMAEKDQDIQIELVREQNKEMQKGSRYSFLVMVILFIFAGYALFLGHVILSGASLVPIMVTYLKQVLSKNKEDSEKN